MAEKKLTTMEQLRALAEKGKLDTLTRIDALLEVIIGVLEGLITCETLGFEDFPCEMTMFRWLSQKAQLLLWRYP